MKKFLLVLLVAVCFVFAGCSNCGTVALIQNSDGTIVETYIFPYAESELLRAGITKEESTKIKQQLKTQLNDTFNSYISIYKDKINNSSNYTEEEKDVLKNGIELYSSLNDSSNVSIEIDLSSGEINEVISQIQYELRFINQTCYLEFKNANSLINEPKTIVTEKTLFTTTTKVIKDPVFDNIAISSITLGKYVSGVAENIIVNVLAGGSGASEDKIATARVRWEAVKLSVNYVSASEQFTYCYVVPTARLKSNADKIEQKKGYYFHYWQVKSNNSVLDEDQIHFEYWTVSANKPVWYAFATGGAGLVILIAYLVSRKKEKKEIEEINKELNV